MRSVHVCSVSTTEASFKLAKYTVTQCPISPYTPRWPRSLPFHEGVCWHLTFNGMPPPMPDEDSKDEEYLPAVDLDDLVWSKDTVPDSHEYLCIHEIPRLATPPDSQIKEYQQHNPHSPIKECQQPHPTAQSRSAINPIPTTWSNRDAPRPWAHGTWHPGGHTKLNRCSRGIDIRL